MFPSMHCFDSGLLCTGGTAYTLGLEQSATSRGIPRCSGSTEGALLMVCDRLQGTLDRSFVRWVHMRVVGSWTEAHRHVPGDINTGKRIKTGYPIPQVPKNPARTITKLLFSIKEGRKKIKPNL